MLVQKDAALPHLIHNRPEDADFFIYFGLSRARGIRGEISPATSVSTDV